MSLRLTQFAFTQQSPALQAAAKSAGRALSPVWVRHSPKLAPGAAVVEAAVLRWHRLVNADGLAPGQPMPRSVTAAEAPDAPQLCGLGAPIDAVAGSLRRYSEEHGVGHRWLHAWDVKTRGLALDEAAPHRVQVLAPRMARWVNFDHTGTHTKAALWNKGIDGGYARWGPGVDLPRKNGYCTASSPLVFSEPQIAELGLALKDDAVPLLTRRRWVPLRCADNAERLLHACVAAGAELPADPTGPVDATTGAPLEEAQRVTPDSEAPASAAAIESGALTPAQLEHLVLPGRVLFFGVPLYPGAGKADHVPVEMGGRYRATFTTPSAGTVPRYSVDSLVDPDMGYRVAGTLPAPGTPTLAAGTPLDEAAAAELPQDDVVTSA